MDKCYDIVILTTSIKDYAVDIVNTIDPKQIIGKILVGKRDLTRDEDIKAMKDVMTKLNVDPKDVVIVDSDTNHSSFSPANFRKEFSRMEGSY